MITPRRISWLITVFFAVVVAIVFQQIHTSMAEQGIASGGPYDNAAAYPRAVAVFMGVLVITQLLMEKLGRRSAVPGSEPVELADLARPAALLVLFAAYLGLLNTLGYHLATTPLVFLVMWLCGARQILKLMVAALALSFVFAYIFENFLNIVLPGGIFRLNIPW